MRTIAIQKSIKLFNAVPKGSPQTPDLKPTLPYGVIVDEYAAYAGTEILTYLKDNKLDSEQLNATFHKSWKVIRDTPREELLVHQLMHYMTTYGTNFTSEFVYFPAEKLELPEIKQIPLKLIRGLDTQVLINKSLNLLSSGVALDETTIDDVLELLEALDYEFESVDQIKNKEALVKVIAKTNRYPSSPVEFLRYLIFLSTKSALLIKNEETIEAIKEAQLDFSKQINTFGLKRCAEVFNRFKPLWLAFKVDLANKPLINEISRLSKKYHQPLPVDILNTITAIAYSDEEITKALKKVNNFRKIRLLNALNTRMKGVDAFLYRVRNGKSFSVKKEKDDKLAYYKRTFYLVYTDLLMSLNLEGVKIKYPTKVDYGLPATEKMFIGNIPVGTKVTSENLVSGVYWENDWGAQDLDLSALSLAGKIGWNSAYKGEGLMYSGDITDAPNGATEYLYTNTQLPDPALSVLNIFSGKIGCKFKIMVGSAPKVAANHMFDPNELILEAEAEMVGRNQILGIFIPEGNNLLSFVLVNAGFGSMSVSGNSVQSDNARAALFYQYKNPILLRQLLTDAGAILVEEGEADISLLPQDLQKDSILNLLGNKFEKA